MQTIAWKDYRLSRMMLGTVQFGMNYGIANTAGQPAYADVVRMVAAALDGGVTGFDTAAAYGDSEIVLGKALRELKALENVLVVTKINALPLKCVQEARSAEQAIRASVDASRHRLGMDCLPLVLFHREQDGRYLDILDKLSEEGAIRHVGVSGGNQPGAAAKFAGGGRVAALQLPANILDRRHARSGIFEICKSKNIATFIRSVYLQGLLLMPEADVPASLKALIPVRRRLNALAQRGGMRMAELACRYMLAQPGISSLVTGVDTLEQLRQNLVLFDRGPLPSDMLRAVEAAVPDLPEHLLTPSTWPSSRG